MFKLQACFIIQQRPIHNPAFMRQLTEVDIFRHGHFRNQMQLLITNRHPGVQRLGGVIERHLLTADLQAAGRRYVVAAENFQQRGFPGAVFSHQGVNLSGIAAKANVGQRFNAREGHGDAVK